MNNQAPPGGASQANAAELLRLDLALTTIEAAAAPASRTNDVILAMGQAQACLADAGIKAEMTQAFNALDGENGDTALPKCRSALRLAAAYIKGQVSIRESSAMKNPTPQTTGTAISEASIQREISRAQDQARNMSRSADIKETDMVRLVNDLYESLPTWVRDYRVGGDPAAVPPVPGTPGISQKRLLSSACQGNPRVAAWWQEVASHLEWDELLRMARAAISTRVIEDEDAVLDRFQTLAKTFEWEAAHKDDRGNPINANIAYAAKLSEILAVAPSVMRGEPSWIFAREARAHLPYWLVSHLKDQKEKDASKALQAIRDIPKEAFSRRQQELDDQRQLAREMLRNSSQRQMHSAAAPQPDAKPRWAPAGQVSSVHSTSADLPSRGSSMPDFWRDTRNGEASQLKPEQASPLTFEDTAAGRDAYKKAVAAFVQMYPAGTNPPLTAKFPLSPGTVSVPALRVCDTCGKVAVPFHGAARCPSNEPVPAAESNYRRLWRTVAARGRGQAPSWLNKKDRAINLLADADELMEDHAALFYGSDSEGKE